MILKLTTSNLKLDTMSNTDSRRNENQKSGNKMKPQGPKRNEIAGELLVSLCMYTSVGTMVYCGNICI